jgi:hypothetical protein
MPLDQALERLLVERPIAERRDERHNRTSKHVVPLSGR